MTTSWTIPPDLWAGETVAVIGAAPGVTDEQLAAVRGLPCLAANHGILRAPWAQVLVAIDGNWPEVEFTGRRVVGAESGIDADYVHMPHERVMLAPGHIVEVRNNAIMALRIAARGGAKRIIVLGVDPAGYDGLGHGGVVTALSVAWPAVVAELRAQGVEIEHYESAVKLRSADAPAVASVQKAARSRMATTDKAAP